MIVGIGSVARVGKDTAASALVSALGFQRIGFADRLKLMAYDINPIVVSSMAHKVNVEVGRGRLQWVVEGLGGWDAAKVQYPEVRIFLQNLGVAARKHLGDQVWINAVLDVPDSVDIVIPDVRFVNEADAILDRGGLLVKINRPGFGPANDHISEHDLANYPCWDLVIENSGSVEAMQETLVSFVTSKRGSTSPSKEVVV